MSFVGSIGNLMSGSGLKRRSKNVMAPNTVSQTLNGKAIARALRGNFPVDGALLVLLSRQIISAVDSNEYQNADKMTPDEMSELTRSMTI